MKKHVLAVRIIIILSILAALTLQSCGRRRYYRRVASQGTNTEMVHRKHHNSFKVKMRYADGVIYMPCKINGVDMEFIFDTGASDIVMSLTEAMFLFKQGKLSTDDIISVDAQYKIADGSIGVGTVVNLSSVTIGEKTIHDVKATIISNAEAPLLLGQSALSRFGEISINFNRNEITFR